MIFGSYPCGWLTFLRLWYITLHQFCESFLINILSLLFGHLLTGINPWFILLLRCDLLKSFLLLTGPSRIRSNDGLLTIFHKVILKRVFLGLLFLVTNASTITANVKTFTFSFENGLIATGSDILREHMVIPLPLRSPLANEVILLEPFLTEIHILEIEGVHSLTQSLITSAHERQRTASIIHLALFLLRRVNLKSITPN